MKEKIKNIGNFVGFYRKISTTILKVEKKVKIAEETWNFQRLRRSRYRSDCCCRYCDSNCVTNLVKSSGPAPWGLPFHTCNCRWIKSKSYSVLEGFSHHLLGTHWRVTFHVQQRSFSAPGFILFFFLALGLVASRPWIGPHCLSFLFFVFCIGVLTEKPSGKWNLPVLPANLEWENLGK